MFIFCHFVLFRRNL